MCARAAVGLPELTRAKPSGETRDKRISLLVLLELAGSVVRMLKCVRAVHAGEPVGQNERATPPVASSLKAYRGRPCASEASFNVG